MRERDGERDSESHGQCVTESVTRGGRACKACVCPGRLEVVHGHGVCVCVHFDVEGNKFQKRVYDILPPWRKVPESYPRTVGRKVTDGRATRRKSTSIRSRAGEVQNFLETDKS